ncbi:hypothetical protein O3M35_003565 [Rhynocoris fuscipes]|uniref:ATP synthase F0 subunit 8 n=1 Tax=Rhynocoris fuscipes TaxID=488301 RepID=A0AAW1CS22_9HEMI
MRNYAQTVWFSMITAYYMKNVIYHLILTAQAGHNYVSYQNFHYFFQFSFTIIIIIIIIIKCKKKFDRKLHYKISTNSKRIKINSQI